VKKEEARLHFKKARRDFRDAEARARLTRHLQRLVSDLHQPETQVCVYRALADEASFELEPVTDFYFPRVEGGNVQFLKPSSARAFAKGQFGISEPVPSMSKPLDPRKPVLIVAPAVAVDTTGTRLGMGKGFYDRFFQEFPEAIRIAAVYQVQVSADVLPRDAWDQPVDWIVTEEMILKVSQKGVRSHGTQLVS
jgi:5-formyltetrahydrofolate cyclo-ligase